MTTLLDEVGIHLRQLQNGTSLSTSMEVVAEWVQFDIPYLLQVEDSIEGNEHARFRVEIDGVPAELQFKKEAQDNERSDRPGMMFGLVEGDRHGNVSYTKVVVGFDQQLLNTIPEDMQKNFESIKQGSPTKWLRGLDNREGRIIRAAVDSINRFLEVYRASLGYYWVRGISPSEIIYFMRTTVSENEDEYNHGLMYPRGGLKPGTATLGEKEHNTLNARLQAEHQVPIEITLRLDAQDKLDLGEYRLAVITAGTMFETFLKDGLKELMAAEGMSDEDIRDVFVGEGDYTGVKTLARETVPKTLHFDFEATEEYKIWNKQTREMRNKVIHEAYSPTQEEARAAYESANEAVEFLRDRMIERREELGR